MPIITKISIQQKRKDRYNIFTDNDTGEKFAFSVDEDVLIKYQLKKGMEIDEFLISEIAYQDDIRKAYNTAIQYLSRRMRSELEVRQFLRAKDIDDIVIQEAIHKLYKYNFLDDKEYAAAYVRTQIKTTDKGPAVIRMELKEKGIAEELIDAALQEYSYDKELRTAVSISRKYIQKNSRDSSRLIKQKLEQLLIRKGFQTSIIREAISEVEFEKSEDEEMAALRMHAEKAHRKFAKLADFEYNQKMKQTLYRKGFSLEKIEVFLNEKE